MRKKQDLYLWCACEFFLVCCCRSGERREKEEGGGEGGRGYVKAMFVLFIDSRGLIVSLCYLLGLPRSRTGHQSSFSWKMASSCPLNFRNGDPPPTYLFGKAATGNTFSCTCTCTFSHHIYAYNLLFYHSTRSTLVHTMDELKLTGNCLKGSRPLLNFDAAFDSEPYYQLLKELLFQVSALFHHA